MLRLKGITKNYQVAGNEIEVLKGLDISFRKNEFVSILGPSGCGKTTTLNIIGGLDKYTSGDLIISGKSTKDFDDRDWDTYRNRRIGFVFQSYNLIPHQTVLSNVELALTIAGISKEEASRRAKIALERVGLKGEEYKRPNQLSGGQCQRVAIARALVNEPDILLADEPTGALDSKTSVQIMEIIKEISKEKLVIMVTHNSEIAKEYSTRIVRLVDGEIIEDSNPYSGEEEKKEEQEKTKRKTLKNSAKKSRMSRWTAFKLSLRNLITKKGRTILTSFAGSIGIIGIALILAVSQGTTGYINAVQESTLSSYPLVLEETAVDLTSLIESFLGTGNSENKHENDAIYKDTVIAELVNALAKAGKNQNDLKGFKKHLDEQLGDENSKLNSAISGVRYSYNINLDIYTENVDGQIVKSDTSQIMSEMIARYMMGIASNGASSDSENSSTSLTGSTTDMYGGMMMSQSMWQEFLPAKDGGVINPLIKSQYDKIHGEWADEYNEIMLVINDKNEIDDLTLYALGLISEEEIDAIINSAVNGEVLENTSGRWTYEEVCEQEYTVILPFNCFMPAGSGYVDMREISDEYLKTAFNNGLKLKVTGIIRQNPDAENHMLTGSIAYNYKLAEHIIKQAEQSEIVKAQLKNPNVDILTGRPFKTSTGNLTNEQKKTAFIEYVSNLTEKEKANTYIAIKSIMPKEMLDEGVKQMLGAYPTREAKVELISSALAMQGAESGISTEQVKKYLEQMTDENINNLATSVCEALVQVKYAQEVSSSLENIPTEQLNLMFDNEMSNENFDYALYYDTVTEFSKTTIDSNLKKLGYIPIDSPSAINIYASSFEDKDVIVEAIDNYNSEVEETSQIKYTDFMGIMMSSITTIIDAISYVLIAFVSISLIVSSIMIGVITLISVQERTKEIGILRAIGASKKNVSSMFNAETLIIGFSSGLIGVLVTYLLCIPINLILHALTGISTLSAILPLPAAIILVVISMLLTLISGIIPSKSAAKKDPVLALRTE